MGGHSRDYISFKSTAYSDWQAPVLLELNALINKGYKIFLFWAYQQCHCHFEFNVDGMIDTTKLNKLFLLTHFVPSK